MLGIRLSSPSARCQALSIRPGARPQEALGESGLRPPAASRCCEERREAREHGTRVASGSMAPGCTRGGWGVSRGCGGSSTL